MESWWKTSPNIPQGWPTRKPTHHTVFCKKYAHNFVYLCLVLIILYSFGCIWYLYLSSVHPGTGAHLFGPLPEKKKPWRLYQRLMMFIYNETYNKCLIDFIGCVAIEFEIQIKCIYGFVLLRLDHFHLYWLYYMSWLYLAKCWKQFHYVHTRKCLWIYTKYLCMRDYVCVDGHGWYVNVCQFLYAYMPPCLCYMYPQVSLIASHGWLFKDMFI